MTNKQIKELQVLGFQISDEDVRYGVAVFKSIYDVEEKAIELG